MGCDPPRAAAALSLSLVLVLAAGCDRPSPLVVCHNAHCAGDLDASRDDTMDALAESLELTHEGRAPFDGVEIDLFWHGTQERCLFAHGFDQMDTASPASDAADAVADYLLASAAPSWNGDLFVFMVELKGEVGEGFRPHDPDDIVPHVECAFDVIERVRAAATAAGHELEVLLDSGDPALVRAAREHPRWDDAGALLSADFGAPAALTSVTHELSEFPTRELDIAEFYPGLVTDAQLEAFRSLDVSLNLWMFTATTAILDSIEQIEPRYVTTGEAELMRRWIEW